MTKSSPDRPPVTDPVDLSLFFTRNDKQDVRLGDWARNSESFKRSFSILGYPDDEGVKLNGGRVGAANAPDEIRKFFYKMTPPLSQDRSLQDLGNLQIQNFDLKNRHQEASLLVTKALKTSKLITFGGGHDYGYPDGAGFLEFLKNKKGPKPLVINFDAHLDVRPLDKGITSGTPFFRLLHDYDSQFDFVEVGLQPQCNSTTHLKWAKEKKARALFMQDIRNKGLLTALKAQLPKVRGPLFLSLDIDVFTSAEAPGCSQSWPTGLSVAEFWPAYQWLLKNYDTPLLSIYEVSPALDVDSRTSKLAACIAYEYLFTDVLTGRKK